MLPRPIQSSNVTSPRRRFFIIAANVLLVLLIVGLLLATWFPAIYTAWQGRDR